MGEETTTDAVIEKIARAIEDLHYTCFLANTVPTGEEVSKAALAALSPGDPLPGRCWVAPGVMTPEMKKALVRGSLPGGAQYQENVYKAMRRAAKTETADG